MTRREMLHTMGAGFGALGIAGVLGAADAALSAVRRTLLDTLRQPGA